MQIVSIAFEINIDDSITTKVFAIYQEGLGNKPEFFSIIENSISDELLTISLLIGGILICFSKLKTETLATK